MGTSVLRDQIKINKTKKQMLFNNKLITYSNCLIIIYFILALTSCQNKINDFNISFSFNYKVDSINSIDSVLLRRNYGECISYDFNLSPKEMSKIYSKIMDYDLLKIPNNYLEVNSKVFITPENNYNLSFTIKGVEKKFQIKERIYSTDYSNSIYGFCIFLERFLNSKIDKMDIPKSNIVIE